MGRIVILGIFVADTTFRADRLPRLGETILGRSFALGPGGKGSNQAVAAGRAGAEVHMVTKLGQDDFGDMAIRLWQEAGVTPAVTRHAESYTGAACIFIDHATGDNAIVVSPGVAATISPADIDAHADLIGGAQVFITQLEQPLDAAEHALRLARDGGAVTILNPAPATEISDAMLGLCDYVTPNETEAEELTGIAVETLEQAEAAADALLARGAGAAIITLGARGALLRYAGGSTFVEAFHAGDVAETTGAGDAFHGGFATALAEGKAPADALRIGCATAALSVTKPGAAASMPTRAEIDALLAGG